MDVFDLLKTMMGQSSGEKPNQSGFGSLAKLAIPFILMSIFKNLQNKSKAESFRDALKDHEAKIPSGVPMKDVFKQRVEEADTTDGSKILGHILGDDMSNVVMEMADKLNVSPQQAKEMMSQLAPAIMEMLAEKTKDNRDIGSLQAKVKEELTKVDQTEGLPNLPDFVKDMMGGKKESGHLLESLGGSDLLKDLIGSLLK